MKNVQDIYPLSPMQQMMLLHTQLRDGVDVLFNQVCYHLTGSLDVAAFRQAWQVVMDRHGALRAAFLSDGLPQPMQVVRGEVELPFSYQDLRVRRGLSEQELVQEIADEDAARPLDPAQAPLMRLSVVRTGDQSYFLLWSTHHLVIDRWSTPVIMREVATAYASAVLGTSCDLPPAPQFRDYIRWLYSRPEEQTREYWRKVMAGYLPAGRLTSPARGDLAPETLPRLAQSHLGGEHWEAVRGFCSRKQLTIASPLLGAWSLVLNEQNGLQDMVIGVVSAGRPAEVPDVEAVVGSFVNNLPARIRLPADADIVKWLSAIQQQSRQRIPYEHASVSQIQAWCDQALSDSLFDNLVVCLAGGDEPQFPGINLEVLSHGMGTAYPLTLYAEERSDGIGLTLKLAEGYSAAVPLAQLLDRLQSFLVAVCTADEDSTLVDLPAFRGRRDAEDLYADSAPTPHRRPPASVEPVRVVAGREQPVPDLIEELVVAQWRSVLGLTEVPPDSDFFSLGGDSLMAARLADGLQTALRREIPILAIFKAPTVSGMVRVILENDWPSHAGVATPIRASGALAPLFCVASPEVDTVGYAILARRLSADRPVYVLQSPPSAERVRRMRPPEVPILAASYIEAIREIQPRGPYNLVGMCSGSQIELEICRRLESEDDRVAFAGVIDSWALFTLSRAFYLKKAIDRFNYYVARVRKLRMIERGEVGRELESAAGEDPQAASSRPEVESPAPAASENFSVVDEVGWPHEQPDIAKITSPVTVFRQKKRQDYWRIRDVLLGWGRHADSVELVSLSAPSHKAIFREPFIEDLARSLERRLDGRQ